ncbi:OsmC family protein [Jiulongibacter sp. NS-SX5]|uniref:OsmC family protein n=1 Tax=Jiulongibacter sp. NS-SX5 TaxID=3463854 RepID=UPI0040596F34
MKEHQYKVLTTWTGNTGSGTSDYKSYERSHDISIGVKPVIKSSSDPAFRGDPSRHNPEELFLASLSSCHMLWYLHFCSVNQIIVIAYTDAAEGLMTEESNGSGKFSEVTLKPKVVLAKDSEPQLALAKSLHEKANDFCFIAKSCNFPVKHEVEIIIG